MGIDKLTVATKRGFAVLAGSAAMLASSFACAHTQPGGPADPFRVAGPSSAILQSAATRQVSPQSDALQPLFAFPAAPAIVALTQSPLVAANPESVHSPLAEAVRSRVNAPLGGPRAAERRAARAAIAAFYAARAYAPLWSAGERWSLAANLVLQPMRDAEQDGLDLRAYRLPAGDAPNAQDELDLSEAVVAYAIQASGGRVDPQKLSRLIGMRPVLPEAAVVLASVSESGSQAGEMLRNFNPRHSGYLALKTKLAEVRAARLTGERTAELQDASTGRTVSDGSPHVRFGARAPETLAGVEAEIVANMERWRWMPHELSATRVEVNIPDFELALVRDGAVAYRSRVIVGKTSTPTPVFSNAMRSVVVNPYWNVPPSILKNEMLARNGGDLSYLQQRGFDVSYHNGRPSVRQRPGERNALGRIKFLFPNEYSVYMHDTPTRGLFAQNRRAFSHGCVRVDQPFRFAEAVLGAENGWPEQRIRALVGASERNINLAQPLPVHIEYFTAFVDENGALQLRDDLYGYSTKVRAALGLSAS